MTVPRLFHRIAAKFSRQPALPDSGRIVQSCTLFYSFFRLQMLIDPVTIGMRPDGGAKVTLTDGTVARTACERRANGQWEVVVEALVDPAKFPGDLTVKLVQGQTEWRIAATTLLAEAEAGQTMPLLAEFNAAVNAPPSGPGTARPKLLDIGGRARSGVQRSKDYPNCDVTVIDIIAAPGVDVVGDAHELSRYFPAATFDFALSTAVFEHLAMPWKVAVEMAKVLKPNGLAMIFTHQTIGMHDLPWDFFRFSDSAFGALFNRATGFEVVATRMTGFMHVVPAAWSERHRGGERAGGFELSSALVRKVGEPAVDWDVRVSDFTATSYPAN